MSAQAPTTLIAGAGGQLGHAIVEAIAAREGRLVLSDVDEDALAALEQRFGSRILLSRAADLRDDRQAEALVGEALAASGALDACVCAFGIEGPIAPVEELDLDAVADLYDVNVFANIRLFKAILPHMREARRGRLVAIASGAGLGGT